MESIGGFGLILIYMNVAGETIRSNLTFRFFFGLKIWHKRYRAGYDTLIKKQSKRWTRAGSGAMAIRPIPSEFMS